MKDAKSYECICDFKNNLSEFQYMFLKDQVHGRALTIEICFQEGNESSNVNNNNSTAVSTLEESVQHLVLLSKTTSVHKNRGSDDDTGNEISSHESDTDSDYIPDDTELNEHALAMKMQLCHAAKKAIPKVITLPRTINRFNFDGVCMAIVETNTGLKSAAEIVNRTLEMVGAITLTQKGLVTTPAYVQHKVKKLGARVAEREANENVNRKVRCFFFDGVAASNLIRVKIPNENGGEVQQVVRRGHENVVLVEQPCDRYIGFISTVESSANASNKIQ